MIPEFGLRHVQEAKGSSSGFFLLSQIKCFQFFKLSHVKIRSRYVVWNEQSNWASVF